MNECIKKTMVTGCVLTGIYGSWAWGLPASLGVGFWLATLFLAWTGIFFLSFGFRTPGAERSGESWDPGRIGIGSHRHPVGGRHSYFLWVVVGFAVLFRIIGLFGEPFYDDDWARFLWDGRETVVSASPYFRAPIEAFSQYGTLGEEWELILNSINHPEYPTIYGPVLQGVFALGYVLAPGKLWGLKSIYLVLDLVLMGLLVNGFTNSQGNKLGNLIWILWNPLWIHEISFNAHPEIIGIVFLVLGVRLTLNGKFFWGALALGLSLGCKPVGILVVPFLVIALFAGKFSFNSTENAQDRVPRTAMNRRGLLVVLRLGAGVSLGYWIPWIFFGGLQAWSQSTSVAGFLRGFEYNSSVYAVVAMVFSRDLPVYLVLFGYGTIYLWVLWNTMSVLRSRGLTPEFYSSLVLVIGLFFLLSPVANPWYLLWALPFFQGVGAKWDRLGVRENWVRIWFVSVAFAYLNGFQLPGSSAVAYEHPDWVRFLEFIPVFLALGYGLIRQTSSRNS